MASPDIFLKLTRDGQDLVGASVAEGYEKQILVESISWSLESFGVDRHSNRAGRRAAVLENSGRAAQAKHLRQLSSIVEQMAQIEADLLKALGSPSFDPRSGRQSVEAAFAPLKAAVLSTEKTAERSLESLRQREDLEANDDELDQSRDDDREPGEQPQGVGEVCLTRQSDISSPLLAKSLRQGYVFETAVLSIQDRIQVSETGIVAEVVYQITLTGVRITQFDLTVKDGSRKTEITESLAMSFQSLQFSYPNLVTSGSGRGRSMRELGRLKFNFDIDKDLNNAAG